MSTRELEAGIVRLKADLARAREVILKTTAAVPVRRGGAGGGGRGVARASGAVW